MLHQLPTLSLATLEDHMVLVEGGQFAVSREMRRKVDEFYLCRFPVSQQLWREVMGSDPEELHFQGQQRPVESVSWYDCQEFIQTLNTRKSGDYRLPSETEWEYAAGEGQYYRGFEYAGSPRPEEVGWYKGNSFWETTPAGYRRPNALGLCDLSGNVDEWCQDEMPGNRRIRRGGNWAAGADSIRLLNRFPFPPDRSLSYLSFRLARSL